MLGLAVVGRVSASLDYFVRRLPRRSVPRGARNVSMKMVRASAGGFGRIAGLKTIMG